MSWTVTDDDEVIQVRASVKDQEELRALIAALEKRLTKENPDV
jgi:hypothetical protein